MKGEWERMNPLFHQELTGIFTWIRKADNPGVNIMEMHSWRCDRVNIQPQNQSWNMHHA